MRLFDDAGAWRKELEDRRARARQLTDAAGADALLVFGCDRHGQGFRYLTGFEPVLGDMWLLLDGSDAQCVLTFQWQLPEARAASGIERWEAAFDPVSLVVALLRGAAVRRLAVAGLDRLPVPAYAAINEGIPGLEVLDLGAELGALRRRKTPLEVKRLRAAARVTDCMLDAARDRIRPGVTENEIVAALSAVSSAAGATLAFEPSVVSGVDDPVPIRRPTDRALHLGDTVMVDIGAEIDGYQADATRTFVVGRAKERQLEAWDVVRRAYDAAVALARPGVPCRELHRAASAVISRAGFTVEHRVGHGIGLATSYEWPSLDREEAALESGVTICIEPGVYARGVGNMKLEDDFVITDDGCEALTSSDATLEVPV
ncbi:MAG: aminopeptidase P family protein [Solirubrobacterales bacterium]|nr:aminopeptidase P family protein [Solirubrobacterales bacterium]